MNFVKSLKDNIVSISEFNRGLAGKIFDSVKKTGPKVVFKNNAPECVLLSPEEYIKLVEQAEDARDLALAMERIEQCKVSETISMEDIEAKYDFKLNDVKAIETDEIL